MAAAFAVGKFLVYRRSNIYQLRAHLYQARNILGEDSSGLSDPYIKVVLLLFFGIVYLQQALQGDLWTSKCANNDSKADDLPELGPSCRAGRARAAG